MPASAPPPATRCTPALPSFNQQDARQDSRETLSTLASDTGGKSFFDLGDLGQAFSTVQADTAGYYLLGYYSTNPARDGRWRTLRVRVTGMPGGAHIRYREGYYAPKRFRRLHHGRPRAPTAKRP